MSYIGNAKSLGDLIRLACEHNADRVAVLYAEKGHFKPVYYKDLFQKIYQFAVALHSLGLRRGDCVALASENCLEWSLTDWAAQTLGVILVPIYPTLPPDQVKYIMSDSGSKAFLGTPEQLKKVEDLDDIIVVPLKPVKGKQDMRSLAETHSLDYQEWFENIQKIEITDVATIIYTSGTTGNPKGAMLQHSSFLFSAQMIQEEFPISEKDIFLSFLPLSHVYERMAGHVLPVAIGATIAYVQSIATFANDMLAVKPTIMLCVPRFLESMRNKIIDSVSKQSSLKRKLFQFALNQGLRKLNGKFAPFAGIMDSLVGRTIRARTGGHLRFFVSGGAAISKNVSEFYMAFGLTILQGYGLTETCAISTVNHPYRNRIDTVGEPIKNVEVKIAQDGEILIRGKSVMRGYLNLPDATAEVIDSQGWLHTGDIGELDGTFLRITDRKKDLIVLGNGKNVAPQPIENRMRQSPLIEEAVLFGDGMEYVCALIIPKYENLTKLAEEMGVHIHNRAELVTHPSIRTLYRKELEGINKELASFERVKKFELLDHTFSIDTGELTPSFKVKRRVVRDKYAELIRGMQRASEKMLV